MAKILVTMPDEFLHRIDGVALNEQRPRSELIREALMTLKFLKKFSVNHLKVSQPILLNLRFRMVWEYKDLLLFLKLILYRAKLM